MRKQCMGVKTTWPRKGTRCCAKGVVKSHLGRWYCRNHLYQGNTVIRSNKAAKKRHCKKHVACRGHEKCLPWYKRLWSWARG